MLRMRTCRRQVSWAKTCTSKHGFAGARENVVVSFRPAHAFVPLGGGILDGHVELSLEASLEAGCSEFTGPVEPAVVNCVAPRTVLSNAAGNKIEPLILTVMACVAYHAYAASATDAVHLVRLAADQRRCEWPITVEGKRVSWIFGARLADVVSGVSTLH